MSRRYLCRAEYECFCFPPGRPVSRATAKRHRKAANDRRASVGMPELPSALHYTDELARAELQRYLSNVCHESIENEYPFSENKHQDMVVPEPCNMEIAEVYSHLEDPIQEVCTLDGSNVSGDGDMSMSDSFGYAFSGDDEEDLELHSMLRESIEEEDSFTHMQEDHFSDESSESENEILDTNTRRENFLSWAKQNKKWLDMAISGGMKQSMWTVMLANLESPFGTYPTVRRNMLEFAQLVTRKYICCKRHMLLREMDALEDIANMEPTICISCHKDGIEPLLCTFEYIPILPRLRAWVADQKSCNILYNYRGETVANHLQTYRRESETFNGMNDYFDGWLYRHQIDSLGGEQNVLYDVFIAPSCDGFLTYKHSSYDCWIIAAMNMNLPPSIRFLIHNLIPLGFVKGPEKPSRIDTYFEPLLKEIREFSSHDNLLTFYDGVLRRVRIHILWFTADLPAVASLCGLRGHNARSPCRFCKISGVYCSSSRHYYFPSKLQETTRSGRRILKERFSTQNLILRDPDEVLQHIDEIMDESIAKRVRDELGKREGLKMRTSLYEFPFFQPFMSVPIDGMHLIMNISKDLMDLFRGAKGILKSMNASEKQFVISDSSWNQIDKELLRAPLGTSSDVFGQPPRATLLSHKWKSIECSDFFRYYACPLFDGHLNKQILKGLSFYSRIIDLMARPTLNEEDVNLLGDLCLKFYHLFEKHFFGYETSKISLCKYTMHLLLHIEQGVRAWGPPVNYSQYWVERLIGYHKNRLQATRLAAESLLESTKMMEAYKILNAENFFLDPDGSNESDDDPQKYLLSPKSIDNLDCAYHRGKRTRVHIMNWLCMEREIDNSIARDSLLHLTIISHGRMLLPCSGAKVTVGAFDSIQRRMKMSRADWYVAVEFRDEENDEKRYVYYGRVLKIMDCAFNSLRDEHGKNIKETLLLISWASSLIRTPSRQIYKASSIDGSFSNPTIVSRSALINVIGVLEHRSSGGMRTYFLDPQREVHGLLDEGKRSPDGLNRNLVL